MTIDIHITAFAGLPPDELARMFCKEIENGPAPERLAALVTAGANVHYRDEGGWTPLIHAALWDNGPCIRLLLERGADIDARNDIGLTALMWTTRQGAESAHILIAVGADVNIGARYSGDTPLMAAAQRGRAETVRRLLARGANVLAQNKQGKTALAYAKESGNEDVIALVRRAHGDARIAAGTAHPLRNPGPLKLKRRGPKP